MIIFPLHHRTIHVLILSISYVNVTFENANFLPATGGKQSRKKKNGNFVIEGMKVQKEQDIFDFTIIY